MIERLRAFPILLKVLIANTIVITIGAIAGTLLTVWVVEHHGVESGRWLMLPFVTAGVLFGMFVNYRLLRAAFAPIRALTVVARDVQQGHYHARAHVTGFPDPEVSSFTNAFNQTLEVVERDRQQIRLLANRVTTAQEEERKRIARDLHDDTAQVLFGQLLRVAGLRANADASMLAAIGEIEDALQQSIESIRSMATELRPPALDDLGLREALDGLCQRAEERTGITIRFRAEGPSNKIPADVRLVLYRLAQEALMNIGKHARATEASVFLTVGDSDVLLQIDDNGRGFRPELATGGRGSGMGLGLFGMKERVDLVHGTLIIDGQRQPGTRIEARIPLKSPAAGVGAA